MFHLKNVKIEKIPVWKMFRFETCSDAKKFIFIKDDILKIFKFEKC
jgi:hypothetical protein